jgi:hypothetical protein
MQNESRKSGSGRGGKKPVAERRYGACRLLLHITVFREDIGQPATVEELEALSGKKRDARLEAIKAACQEYIQGPMLEQLGVLLRQTLQTANLNANRARVEPDPADPDGQSLLLWYPTATAEGNAYIRRAIKIESGAKSALDPHASVVVKPYIADDLPSFDLAVGNVTTVDPRSVSGIACRQRGWFSCLM